MSIRASAQASSGGLFRIHRRSQEPGAEPQAANWHDVGRQCGPALHDPAVARLVDAHPEWLADRIVPRRVAIETIFGCNAKCTMCVIDHPTTRSKGIMDMALFTRIVKALVPYRDRIEMFDLFALGEPLLDPHLFERIRYVKENGFRRLAISTNAHLLDHGRPEQLLESGIDTVILSIDGVRKETHEAIRVKVDFDRAVENIRGTVAMRDKGDYPTRFVMRFIRQDLNRSEWPEFRDTWLSVLSPQRGDVVTVYDMHTWAGRIASKDDVTTRVPEIEREPCHHIFDNMMILANGALALCSEDMLEGSFGFGNVADEDPIELYNSERFDAMRRLHLAGRKNCVGTCAQCTLLYSERQRSSE